MIRLETLEDRCAPASFLFNIAAPSLDVGMRAELEVDFDGESFIGDLRLVSKNFATGAEEDVEIDYAFSNTIDEVIADPASDLEFAVNATLGDDGELEALIAADIADQLTSTVVVDGDDVDAEAAVIDGGALQLNIDTGDARDDFLGQDDDEMPADDPVAETLPEGQAEPDHFCENGFLQAMLRAQGA